MFAQNPPKQLVISRKAQDAGAAASLVAIIGLLIIFYLLFVPPSFRDQILEGNETAAESGTAIAEADKILLASPGTLTPISTEEIEHAIPAVQLYSKTKSQVLETKPNTMTKTSVFGPKPSEMHFIIDDIENTDNALLSFISDKHKGNLIVHLNGNEIYDGEITKTNPEPIALSKRFLQEGNNKLTFTAEKTGLAFWRVNKHQMSNLQITASIKDKSQQHSMNVFVVSATEKANVKRAIIRFSPDCIRGKTGKLNVLINTHSIFYSVPDCGGRVAIEFSPDAFREGENTITFESEEGSYLIDLVRITSELKKVIQPAYYFEITKNDLDLVREGKANLWLKMIFTDAKEQKSATININGRETQLYQYDIEYKKNINDYVIEGNNAVKIEPDTMLQIVSLSVVKE